jgi:hypothetical protein
MNRSREAGAESAATFIPYTSSAFLISPFCIALVPEALAAYRSAVAFTFPAIQKPVILFLLSAAIG